jgi:16S rRNA (adenine1518-N6/adenine1519-N6)-dimethyltransferase
VVRMVPLAAPAAVDEALLSEIVQVAFSQRRKILRHTLGKWLEAKGYAGEFDVQRRAEEVPVAEYVRIAAALSTRHPRGGGDPELPERKDGSAGSPPSRG